MKHVTIIQQGVAPKVVEAVGDLHTTLSGQGIDLDDFAVMRGGQAVDLYAAITSDVTVTVTKRSVGA